MLYKVIDLQVKGITKLIYRIALFKAENRKFQTVNKVLSKRQKAKKSQLYFGGLFNIAKAKAIQVEKGIVNARGENIQHRRNRIKAGKLYTR